MSHSLFAYLRTLRCTMLRMDDKEQFKVLAEAFTFWVICVGRAIKEGGSTNLDVRHDEAYRAAAGVIDALDNIPEKE